MATVYRSRIDAWLVVVLGVAMAVALGSVYPAITAGTAMAWAIAIVTVAIGVGLPLWLLLATHYTLDRQHLLVRSGPLNWRIPLRDITTISPSRSLLSSPALSLDRLRIDYKPHQSLMISPRDKAQFLRAIATAQQALAHDKA